MHIRNYYKRSWWARAGSAAVLLFAVGCASANGTARDAPRVAFAQLNEESSSRRLVDLLSRGEPVVIQFHAGQVIPVHFGVDSRLFELSNDKAELVVQKDFQLLLWDGPPLVSEDGVDFETRPKNSFRLGFGMKKGQKPSIDLRLGIRQRGRSEP